MLANSVEVVLNNEYKLKIPELPDSFFNCMLFSFLSGNLPIPALPYMSLTT